MDSLDDLNLETARSIKEIREKEKEIIKNYDNNHSSEMLTAGIIELNDLRNKTYFEHSNSYEFNSAIYRASGEDKTTRKLIYGEYKQYCKFIARLITKESLPFDDFVGISRNFLENYSMISRIDYRDSAYNTTSNTVDKCKEYFAVASVNDKTDSSATKYYALNQLYGELIFCGNYPKAENEDDFYDIQEAYESDDPNDDRVDEIYTRGR